MCTGGSSSWLSDSTDELSPDDHQTALLVGLLSFLSLCVAAVTAATHKRCHQRLRRLLSSADNKNSSTDARNNKNNSYKSSPSGTRPLSLSLFLSLSRGHARCYTCVNLCLCFQFPSDLLLSIHNRQELVWPKWSLRYAPMPRISVLVFFDSFYLYCTGALSGQVC